MGGYFLELLALFTAEKSGSGSSWLMCPALCMMENLGRGLEHPALQMTADPRGEPLELPLLSDGGEF